MLPTSSVGQAGDGVVRSAARDRGILSSEVGGPSLSLNDVTSQRPPSLASPSVATTFPTSDVPAVTRSVYVAWVGVGFALAVRLNLTRGSPEGASGATPAIARSSPSSFVRAAPLHRFTASATFIRQ